MQGYHVGRNGKQSAPMRKTYPEVSSTPTKSTLAFGAPQACLLPYSALPAHGWGSLGLARVWRNSVGSNGRPRFLSGILFRSFGMLSVAISFPPGS